MIKVEAAPCFHGRLVCFWIPFAFDIRRLQLRISQCVYPDVDETAAAILALVTHDTISVGSSTVVRAATWILQMQNDDGGLSEDLQSYRNISRAGKGLSTLSQTSWALMELLGTCSSHDRALVDGIAFLVETQSEKGEGGASWPESRYTGTSFPNYFYHGYELYPHYFTLMALGRYARKVTQLHDWRLNDRRPTTNGDMSKQPKLPTPNINIFLRGARKPHGSVTVESSSL